MTVQDVLALIEPHRDERGIAHWQRRFPDSAMRSLGVGLTVLRGLAKQIGRDHELAQRLWAEDLYEARVIALLIDDPSRITRAQAEAQVEQLAGGQLAYVFSSCDASLAKVPFVRALADDWMVSADPVRQGCGYGLLYEMSKEKGKKAQDEAYFVRCIDQVERSHTTATVGVRLAMASALMGVGKRSASLNRRALEVARALGPVDWDPTGACEPFDAVKHLDSERLRAKLGIKG
jgi:hypothetical protein